MSEEINLKAIHQLQEYCQQANKKIGELNKQLKQARADVIEEVVQFMNERFAAGKNEITIDSFKRFLTKLSEVEK